MIKIAFIVRHYNKRSGIARHVAELAERFAQNDEVHVYTASIEDARDSRIIFHKVPIISVPLLHRLKKYAWNNIFEIASFALFSFIMLKRAGGYTYDIIHSQGDYIGNIDVYTAHSCHKAWLQKVNCEKLSFIDRLKKSALNPLHMITLINERLQIRHAAKIIAVSSGVKKEICVLFDKDQESIETIPNGVDLVKFTPENRRLCRDRIRQEWGIKTDDMAIIFPAHEFRRKGLEQIIEAMRIAGKEKIHLMVIGRDDVSLYRELAGKYKLLENIHFLGNRSNIHEYYAASDVMVFPTLYEAFSLATLESIASGVPLLTTDVNGTAEILKDGVDGLIIRRDPEDIAQKLLQTYENRGVLKRYGVEARKVAENFSWDNIALKTRELYRIIIKEKTE